MTSSTYTLNGQKLSSKALTQIAAGASVNIAPAAFKKMMKSNDLIHQAANSGKPVYGVTTGLGPRVKLALSAEDIQTFSLETVRGRAHSVGTPLARDIVRAAMAIRLNTLLIGASGANPNIAQHIASCLNANLTPRIGQITSTGAGDLMWGGSMALALVGEGLFLNYDTISATAIADAGIAPLKLGPRDGLALVSHTSFTAAFAALAHAQAFVLWQSSQTAAALSLEGFRANLSPFRTDILAVRPQPGAKEAALDLQSRLQGSELNQCNTARRLQDPLSFRNLIQVNGSVHAALETLNDTVLGEINGASDNPVVLIDHGEILSSGGFLNPHLGVVLVGANHALVHQAAQITSRITRMISHRFTDLPNGLVSEEANAVGLGPLTKVAEALFAEIAHLATPPYVYPSASADGVEDAITNAAISGRAMMQINDRLSMLIAIEMIISVQAIEVRDILHKITPALRPIIAKLRSVSPSYSTDRSMSLEIDKLADMIKNGDFTEIA